MCINMSDAYWSGVKALDEKVGAFLSLRDPAAAGVPAGGGLEDGGLEDGGPLAGVPFGVTDNIAAAEQPLTCASRMLEDFRSPYTATAVARLEAAGALPVGKTNLDEFGMGSSTENSALGATGNPWDLARVPGGSSGGSAAAVAAGMVPFALGSDTGGSVRQPAAFCGVLGLKPTYGTVSRYGLVAYASSLEGVGVLARSVDRLEQVYGIIRGKDPLDQTSLDPPAGTDGPAAPAAPGESSDRGEPAEKTLAVLANPLELAEPVRRAYEESCRRWEALGYTLLPVELPSLDAVIPAYYTIAAAEASANLARFNGIRYGRRYEEAENPEELVRRSRDEGFGPEVKHRILLGTYVLRSGFQDQYYLRAQKIRTAVRRELAALFEKAAALLTPVYPTLAFPRGEGGLTPYQQKLADLFTATANLAGIPALAYPAGLQEGLPAGLQLAAPAFRENRLFRLTRQYLEAYPFQEKPPHYLEEQK